MKATVTVEKLEAGWRVVPAALAVRGTVPGIDAATFTELAEAGKDGARSAGPLEGNVPLSVEATHEGSPHTGTRPAPFARDTSRRT